MRIAKVVLALLVTAAVATALSGCIVRTSPLVEVQVEDDGHHGGPPPGRGWKK
jgi:hypothetical protein